MFNPEDFEIRRRLFKLLEKMGISTPKAMNIKFIDGNERWIYEDLISMKKDRKLKNVDRAMDWGYDNDDPDRLIQWEQVVEPGTEFAEPDYDSDPEAWLSWSLETYRADENHSASVVMREEHFEREFGLKI